MKRIYLTGAQATGKSTLITHIKKTLPKIEVISYSSILQSYLTSKFNQPIEHLKMRAESSHIITPEDIDRVDKELINIVHTKNLCNHVIVDSHAITNEWYGFRATPFSVDVLKQLNFDLLFSLYAPTDDISQRLLDDPAGRMLGNKEEIYSSMFLQNSVALSYGIILNKPTYFLNSSKEFDKLSIFIVSKILDK
ncbi:MAG: AAA family ATPase [Firmicutes bacterium]|nr:AAA family ATPase [Bacillota bacterium]